MAGSYKALLPLSTLILLLPKTEGMWGKQREKILERFRSKKTRILVATDVAARGIDIEGITHVVNYSIPYDGPTYTHRIGRTGRAGAKGTAVSFIRPNERRRIDYLRRHARGELQEGKIPSIEKVLAQKQERLFSDLRRKLDTVRAEHTVNKPFIELAQELLAENKASFATAEENAADGTDTAVANTANIDEAVAFGAETAVSGVKNISSVEVLAAVLQLHYGSVLSASHYRNIKVPRTEDKRGKFSGGNTIRLYIGLGRKDGTSKRSLAQFFSTLLSIPEHAVDHIELFDRFSLADLPADAAHEALRLSKKKANMPHIHIDTKSGSVNEKSPHTAGYTKKSPSRKLREGNRREAFFRDKDTRKKHPVSAGSAAADLR